MNGVRGVIISGGPSSVYDRSSPTIDPAVLEAGKPVLGICYGEQLIAHLMGGTVTPGDRGEFGLATLVPNGCTSVMLTGTEGPQQVWMSHRDLVSAAPPGFTVVATTSTCPTGS